MILEALNFKNFYTDVESIFMQHFLPEEVEHIMEFVEILADANFRCYIANMYVIKERKKENIDYKLIADMEWVARSVGEYRVSSKARINNYISRIKSTSDIVAVDVWTSDDIVYSIGEMMDRLSIETIKREDFRINQRPQHMIDSSQSLSNRVKKFLKAKLDEIDTKHFYECVHEQRTYDLEGIMEELVI